jgi:anti-sigma regulatory factor (Ser/Thr protein kinase)
VTAAEVVIIIEDEGAGFDRSLIPDPLADENLEKCSGRGILLIESYMTEAKWTKGGRRLRMVMRNKPS